MISHKYKTLVLHKYEILSHANVKYHITQIKTHETPFRNSRNTWIERQIGGCNCTVKKNCQQFETIKRFACNIQSFQTEEWWNEWKNDWRGKKSKCHFNNPSGLTTCPHGCGVPHFGAIVISIFMDFDPYKHPYCMYVLRPSSLLHILLSTAKVFKLRHLLLFWANIFVSFEHVLAKNR